MIPPQHLKVLKMIVTRLNGQPFPWVVTGSTGMILQGLPLEAHDIDLQTSQAGSFEIVQLFEKYQVSPVRYRESERIRSYLGKLEIDGIQVEIMGDLQKRLDTQEWEDNTVRFEDHRIWLEVDEMQVPVLSLDYEYIAYLRMGRTERAAMIKAWLEKNKQG